MKKIISCFILCAMLLTAIPFSVSASDSNTTTQALEIGTVEAMEAFGTLLAAEGGYSGDVKLTADIDMTGVTWSGKGTFSGTFDGQGYTISNLTITGSAEGTGLFGNASGTIKNLNINGANITNDSNNDTAALVGATAGALVVSNVNVSDTEISSFSNGYIAGIVGRAKHTTTIKNCFVDANFTAASSVAGVVCGWVPGATEYVLTVNNCYVTGTITSGKNYGAGILAYSKPSNASEINISDCVVNSLTVITTYTGTDQKNGRGGLIGHLDTSSGSGKVLAINIARCSVIGFTVQAAETVTETCGYTGMMIGRMGLATANKGGITLDVVDVVLSGSRTTGNTTFGAAIGYINSNKSTNTEVSSLDIKVNNIIVNYTGSSLPVAVFGYYARSNNYDSLALTNIKTNLSGAYDIKMDSTSNCLMSYTPSAVSSSTSYDVSAWENWTPSAAFKDNLPRPTAVCADYIGYQERGNDVRLIFGIKDVNVAALDELGAKITHGGQMANATVPAVYTQIKAGTNVCTAESVGYDYFYVIEFTDMFDGETTSYDFKFEATYKIDSKSYVNTTTDEVTIEKKQ